MEWNTPLRSIKGVGEKSEQLFQKVGVCTVGDMLLYFPRTYEQYPQPGAVSSFRDSEAAAVAGELLSPAKTRRTPRIDITQALIRDDEGAQVECIFFRMPYLSSRLRVHERLIFYGKLEKKGRKWTMEQPSFFSEEQYRALLTSYQPVYPLTQGLTSRMIRKVLGQIFDAPAPFAEDEEMLPRRIVEREGFLPFLPALRAVHFPHSFEELQNGRDRLVYQEFFSFILQNRMGQKTLSGVKNPWTFGDSGEVERVLEKLPYALTDGQKETLAMIRSDLRAPFVSQRLIQGDVGSGKTIVAFLAMVDAAAQGYQAAIMAPTEVLAKQHERTFLELCESSGLDHGVVCLVGSMSAKEKKQARERIKNTPGLLIVGTHALIQDTVEFLDLALVVTDEQHRFGVRQRERLAQKGATPHVLVMSATPIPRTLALILYGNMQLSAIRERPAHRQKIKTCVIREEQRKTAYHWIEKEIEEGRQAYVICPLVEAGEQTEAENVTDYAKKLRKVFRKEIRIKELHGRMPGEEKTKIMEDFAAKHIDILVSTTVVEVGINVPNATVIMIENADSFGLAQLHQLRGRVGRGPWQSYCILMDQSRGVEKNERLDVLNRSDDGFYIAEEDLRLRGPGDFFGIRQSGELNFRLADIIGDAKWLSMAADDVKQLLEDADSKETETEIQKLLERGKTFCGYIL